MGDIVRLAEIGSDALALVGGKALGLSALIRAGFDVPAGFVVTTEAFRDGRVDVESLRAALEELGDAAVAVRSSATAEDLPDASFAGQQDTYLGVHGVEAVADAIRRCWASLHTDRAIAYRAAHGIASEPAMGVVVQRMVDPVTAGVLFTVDPISQTRGRLAIDAVAGLGTAVVDGSAVTDHYVVDRDGDINGPVDGCLDPRALRALTDTGRAVEDALGSPQDIEWAIDRDGRLWLVQSRAITSLFPLMAHPDDGRRAFMEVGHMQGIQGPVTPMGQSVMWLALRDWLRPLGIRYDQAMGDVLMTYIGGRMFIELTRFLTNPRTRSRLDAALDVYGPRVKRSVRHLLDDPRFAACPRGIARPNTQLVRVLARVVPLVIGQAGVALINPERARARAFASVEVVRYAPVPARDLEPLARLRATSRLQQPIMHAVNDQLGPLFGALLSRGIAASLLRGLVDPDEINETQRGMPHNVTTEMDLALWTLAERARPYADLLTSTSPRELTRRHAAGELPDIGLEGFLERYGHRGTAEIDIGVPRWREDPTAVWAALAGYLKVTDPEAAPDRRFAVAAADAERALAALSERAIRERPVRGRIGAFLLRRNRELGGLRELPKFTWLYPLEQIRQQLLLVGQHLVDGGVLGRPDDIMMLFWEEAQEAARGRDQRGLVAVRRATYARELKRAQVPPLLLSDGTDVEATLPPPTGEGVLMGLAAAPGVVTGRVAVVHDPREARIEPGDILVAATTDPGWTPLFMTAGGLVTETGSPMAHGPTVAREYGIPAVICVRGATTLLVTGDLIEVDGSTGTVRRLENTSDEAPERNLPQRERRAGPAAGLKRAPRLVGRVPQSNCSVESSVEWLKRARPRG